MWKRGDLLRGGLLTGLLVAAVLSGCADRDESYYEPDLTPPQVGSLTEDGGQVSWQTDENATCVLTYGSRSGTYDHYAYHVMDGGLSHYVDLIDIEPGTYYFRVIATDPAGNESTAPETSMVIAEVPDTEDLRYTAVDVGWGDCHFLEFPGGTTVLVDAANDGAYSGTDHRADVDAFLLASGIKGPSGIDYMVATHAHRDHYGGFISLLPRFSDTYFMWPDDPADPFPLELTSLITDYDIPSCTLVTGMSSDTEAFLDWDPAHGVEVTVFSSGAGKYMTSGQSGSTGNNDSVVLKITYGEVDILLCADAEFFVEQRTIKAFGAEVSAEVFKVGHHGNDDATSEEWLHYLKARVGFISNSLYDNDGVFDQSVINLLLDHKVDYYVTDRAYRNAGRKDAADHGNLTITTDGETYTVMAWSSS
ncbi:MAG: MBL fold metallo-hydrolase [bacterium]|jgi:beta-lactamase superfamily II metal-dependent hydrolase